MIAIGDGAKEIILEDIEKLGGLNAFTLYRASSKQINGRRFPIRSKEHFNYSDVLADVGCSWGTHTRNRLVQGSRCQKF